MRYYNLVSNAARVLTASSRQHGAHVRVATQHIRWSGARYMSGQTAAERAMEEKLKQEFMTEDVVVQDQSGGCGAQYVVEVVSDKFKGLSTIKQHRLVHSVLKEEVADMHAIRVFTKTP
eukprot:m.15827 g.15827  ORF g.15827 m.15827 type:complete len:119 (+) comp5504_c0_seq1:107-463(+)